MGDLIMFILHNNRADGRNTQNTESMAVDTFSIIM